MLLGYKIVFCFCDLAAEPTKIRQSRYVVLARAMMGWHYIRSRWITHLFISQSFYMPTTINFRQAQFLTSAPSLRECPPEMGTEVAFAGRSNAGKSSAINRLTQNTKLARTSKTPGRTQLINYFTLGSDLLRLVDLPGYGYAKVPMATKLEWQANLSEYLQERETLVGLVLLMDIRHPLQEFDTMMLGWSISVNMPVHILLTKCDKLKRGPAKTQLFKVQKQLTDLSLYHNVSIQIFSALKGEGIPALEAKLSEWLQTEDPE